MIEWKELNADEFDAWLKAYPRRLVRDVCMVGEPPLVTWNDFELAPKWPESIVASTYAESGVYRVRPDD